MGWVDAFIERMLMTVILVKDEVEQMRFAVQPFSMVASGVDEQYGESWRVLRGAGCTLLVKQQLQTTD